MGYMGKFALSAAALLVLLGTIVSADAKPVSKHDLATRLPSQVKKIKKATYAPKAKSKARLVARKTTKTVAPEPIAQLDDSGLSPFDDKFVSKTVYFAASTAPVPEEYDCSAEIEEKQMRQAEREAIAKCEVRGEEHCRLHQIKIVKKGELRCQDIPGRDCAQKKFYRGCVAQAIVVAGEEPAATASVF